MADLDLAKERAKFLGVFPNAHWTDGATCPDQTWAINTWQGWLAARRQHGSAAQAVEPKLCDFGNADDFVEAHEEWQEAQRNAEVGAMIYNGNTVSYMYSKARNYGNVLVECCNLLGGEGHVLDRIKALIAERDAPKFAAPSVADTEGVMTWQQRCNWTSDEPATKLMVEAMKAEIAELRAIAAHTRASDGKDGERWRWFRQHGFFWRGPNCLQTCWPRSGEIGAPDPSIGKVAIIDAAIDAAIAAKGAEQTGGVK